MRKLDVFNHFFPDAYFRKMLDVAPAPRDMGKRVRSLPGLRDLEMRFRVMDEFDDYQQILSMPSPPIEAFADSRAAVELATIGSDGFAELVARHRDRFPGF